MCRAFVVPGPLRPFVPACEDREPRPLERKRSSVKRVILLVALLATTVGAATAEARTLSASRAKTTATNYGLHHIAKEKGVEDYDVLHCAKAGHNRYHCKVHIAFDETGTPPGADCESVLTIKFKSAKGSKVVAVEGPRDCNH
jgi:hypothetical protein